MAAVLCALRMLEASPLTNAGIAGANLTLAASVECDAAIAESLASAQSHASDPASDPARPTQSFGGVGAVPMTHAVADSFVVAHPIDAAAAVARADRTGRDAVGRVPPMMLAGSHVHDFAIERNVPCIPVADARAAISDTQMRRYLAHKRILQTSRTQQPSTQDLRDDVAQDPIQDDLSQSYLDDSISKEVLFDTVGAIAVDCLGNVCAGVSSGGISLKYPGRIGEAAVYGAGIWAQAASESLPGIAISVSGTGEQIIKTQLASRLADALESSSDIVTTLEDFIDHEILQSSRIASSDQTRDIGFICIRIEHIGSNDAEGSATTITQSSDSHHSQKRHKHSRPSSRVLKEFSWAHTTETMCLAFMSSTDPHPTFHFSSRPSTSTHSLTTQQII
eukprot:jgi/Hompol1/6186/HPOL_004865-RA